ncbi:MAG: DUF2080 family transposase-associated protein [Candidatus Nitrosopolaris sp.]
MKQKEIQKIAAIASEFNSNSGHILVPKSWVGKRVIAQLKSQLDEQKRRDEIKKKAIKP